MSNKNLVNTEVDSDEDDDDDDYCPTKTQNEQSDVSDESEDNDDDGDADNDATVNNKNQAIDSNKPAKDLNVTPYDESKTNELWKSFESSTKSSSSTTIGTNNSSKSMATEAPKIQVQSLKPTETSKILEFAGEKISVPIATTPKTPSETSSLKRPASSSTTSNSVLDRLGIGKKQKLSTLEKSRLDWDSHKESESLKEDLESHRRSKDSFVEKKAFLQRTELREHDHYLAYGKKK